VKFSTLSFLHIPHLALNNTSLFQIHVLIYTVQASVVPYLCLRQKEVKVH